MASNIRFRVHTRSDEYLEREPEIITGSTIFLDTENPADALFTMLNMATMLHPTMSMMDPLQMAMQQSMEDQELRRQENVVVNVNSQRYDTTEKKWNDCTICTDKYNDEEMVSVLSCGHVFHPKCIKEWGHYSPSCPVCKAEIPTSRRYYAR